MVIVVSGNLVGNELLLSFAERGNQNPTTRLTKTAGAEEVWVALGLEESSILAAKI